MRYLLAAVLLVAFASPATAAIFYDDPTGWVGDDSPALGIYLAHRYFHFDTPVQISIDYRSDLYSYYNQYAPGVWIGGGAVTSIGTYNLTTGIIAALSVSDPPRSKSPTLEQVDRPADITQHIVSTISAQLPAGDYRIVATSLAQFFMSSGGGKADLTIGQVSIVPVPEPATFWLAAAALPALAAMLYRSRKRFAGDHRANLLPT